MLILENGAYGRRQVQICKALGIPYHHECFGENEAVDENRVRNILEREPGFTHVGVVHCETSSGLLNPIERIGKVIKEVGQGWSLAVSHISLAMFTIYL